MISEVSDTDLDYDDWGYLLSKVPQDSSWSYLVDQLNSPATFHPSTSFLATKLPQMDCSSLYKIAIGSIFLETSVRPFFPIASEILRGQVSSKGEIKEKPLPAGPSELDALHAPISADDSFNLLARCIDNKQFALFEKIIAAPQTPVLEPLYSFYLLYYISIVDEKVLEEATKDLIRNLLESPKLTFDQKYAGYMMSALADYGDVQFLLEMFAHEKFSGLSPSDKMISIIEASLVRLCCCC